MKINHGVRVFGIQPEMVLAAMVVTRIYARQGIVAIMTSGIEGRHMSKSLHYVGYANDWAANELINPETVAREIDKDLGIDYDVIYSPSKKIIHIEFQPKQHYG